jgi:hypothetical protein
MATQKVNIEVSTRGAKKSQEELKGLRGTITNLGKAVGVASAAYFGAKGLINSFSSVIHLAGIQEDAEKKLETALGKTSQRLLEQASALQEVTRFGDEATIQQQAFLASIGFSEEKIMDIIPVAMDLAEATGMSLESAVRNTAKTFSGLAGELGELVPQLRDLTAEEMKAGNAVKVLANLFEGQATAQAQTMSGALDQARNSAGDLAEAIGNQLSPLVKVIATDFSSFTQQLTDYINEDTISDEEQLNNLLRERRLLHNEEKEAIEEAIYVSDIFNTGYIERNQVSEVALNTSKEALDAEISRFDHLIFKQQKQLDIIRTSKNANIEFGAVIERVNAANIVSYNKVMAKKNAMIQQDIKNAFLSGQSAEEAMRAVVKAEAMEAVAGFVSSVFKTVPFPFNIAAAAGAGLIVSSAIDKGIDSIANRFATGGIVPGTGNTDSVPAMLTPGEVILNEAQQRNLTGKMGGITINVSAPLVDETIIDTIIPAIEKARRLNLA